MCFCPESRKSPPSGWTSHYKRIALLKSCWFYRRLTRSREATIRSTWPANAFLIDFASSTVQRSWSWRFSTWLDPPSTCFNTMWINWGFSPTNSMFALDILPLCSQISGKYQIIPHCVRSILSILSITSQLSRRACVLSPQYCSQINFTSLLLELQMMMMAIV